MFTTANTKRVHHPSPAWLAEDFASVSLQELNQKAAMLERLDNKYVLKADALASAVPDLVRKFEVLEIDGLRAFTYDTCYFDDADLHSYYDHHQGRRQRIKVRVRRYVDAALCFVEVKLKDKRGATVKKRMPYELNKFGTLDAAALAHVRQNFEALYQRPFEHTLAPVLNMSYRRITLVATDGGERMTIDFDIRFHGANGALGPASDMFIVETKSAQGRGLADDVLRGLHQRPTSACSKYCVGMSMTGQVSRFNRFLPALRKLGAVPSRAPLLPMPAPSMKVVPLPMRVPMFVPMPMAAMARHA